MTTYVIADIKVTDDSWVPEYAANVHDIVHKHGGKYLTRTSNIKTVEKYFTLLQKSIWIQFLQNLKKVISESRQI